MLAFCAFGCKRVGFGFKPTEYPRERATKRNSDDDKKAGGLVVCIKKMSVLFCKLELLPSPIDAL
jgi:hypothetical protein